MYTFYTDKQEVFECNLDLEGAKLIDSKARLVLESENYNLLFYGKINENGKCEIPVKRLKNLLSEMDSGKVKLEVIAEDTYFQPWSDSYNVKTSKKVTVEVVTKEAVKQITEKKVKVTAIQQTVDKTAERTTKFLKLLERKNITLANIKENIKTVQTLSTIFTKKYSLSDSEKRSIVEGVIKKLK
tara:strand:- start:394 stop:948 length:555 start_codon:yes stop_codon:yes gene_type:complete